MPIQDHFELPKTAQELPLGDGPAASLFLCYISSVDPVSKQPWCPDVRAALPRLDKTFSSQDAPRLAYVHVGQKPEYVRPSPQTSLAVSNADPHPGGRHLTTFTGRNGT
jgi:hypothetical protein